LAHFITLYQEETSVRNIQKQGGREASLSYLDINNNLRRETMKVSQYAYLFLIIVFLMSLNGCASKFACGINSKDFFHGEIGVTPVGSSGRLVNVPEGKVPIVTDIFLKNGNPEPVDLTVFSAINVTVKRIDGVREQPIVGIRAVGNELTHIHFKKGVRLSEKAESIRATYSVGTAPVISVTIAGYFENAD
jgi:hypothetical protein